MTKLQKRSEPLSQTIDELLQLETFEPGRAPLIRACGCVHRFQSTGTEEKSMTVCRRRSRSCTPGQKTGTQNVISTKLNDESCMRSRVIPNRYTTTIYVDLNSSTKHFVEEISLQVCPISLHPDCRSIYKATIETTIKQTLVGNANPIKKVVIQCGGQAGDEI